jgi:hypothetical protein
VYLDKPDLCKWIKAARVRGMPEPGGGEDAGRETKIGSPLPARGNVSVGKRSRVDGQ